MRCDSTSFALLRTFQSTSCPRSHANIPRTRSPKCGARSLRNDMQVLYVTVIRGVAAGTQVDAVHHWKSDSFTNEERIFSTEMHVKFIKAFPHRFNSYYGYGKKGFCRVQTNTEYNLKQWSGKETNIPDVQYSLPRPSKPYNRRQNGYDMGKVFTWICLLLVSEILNTFKLLFSFFFYLEAFTCCTINSPKQHHSLWTFSNC